MHGKLNRTKSHFVDKQSPNFYSNKYCSTLIDRARIECQNHWFVYNERMSVESCAQAVSTLAIQFGDSYYGGSAMSRPFGVAILFAGVENGDPQLWHMDPSGTYIRYDAKAIGSGSEGAQQNLQVINTNPLFENPIEMKYCSCLPG